MENRCWIILCAVFLGWFSGAQALTCYSCGSAKDCNDDFESNSPDVTEITTIGGEDCLYCTKTKAFMFGAHSALRSCVANDDNTYELGCHSEDQSNGGEVIMCYCDSDRCNHGNKAMASFLTVIVSFLVIRFM